MSKPLPLLEIQKLQFHDKNMAERQLLQFLQEHEDPAITGVELRPKPESLNSINGILTYASGEQYFFKAHVEENEKISEYYNASILAQVGYPVITAKRIKQRPGQQIALYEIVSLSTLFDLLKIEEDEQAIEGKEETQLTPHCRQLLAAQADLERTVCDIYKNTLTEASAQEHASAPVHQLFSHRLADDGRVGMFYKGKSLILDDVTIPFARLGKLNWIINGVKYDSTLEQIIERSRMQLTPKAGPAIIGHGDAHNGNIFVDHDATTGGRKLVMFDPAFAGKHDPLLDITKPLFHNLFARWMYFPEQVQNEFQLTYELRSDAIVIEHTYKISQLRVRLLELKINLLLKPIIKHLSEKQLLANDWQAYLRSALFCCPFLTVNLFSASVPGGTLAERYSPTIKLLALSMAVEFGSLSHAGVSFLSDIIDNQIFETSAV